MAGAKHRMKGDRIEREIVELLKAIGFKAERVPLSGATRYRGARNDIDVYPFGQDEEAWVFEVKGRKDGNGFRMLDRWLGDNDGLFLRRNRAKPGVYLPWESLVALFIAARDSWRRGLKKELRDEILGRRGGRAEEGGRSDVAIPMARGRRRAPASRDRAGDALPAIPAATLPGSAVLPLDGPASRPSGGMAPGKAGA